MTINASGNDGKNPVDDPSNQKNVSSGDIKTDSVPRDSYLKLLNEKRKRDADLAEYRDQLEKIQLEKMQAEGNKDALITELQKKYQSESEARRKEKESFVWSSVNNQIKRKADQLGCTDTSVLLKLMEKDDFSSLTVNDRYEIEEEALENLLNAKKEKFASLNLFNQRKPNINNPSQPYMPHSTNKSLKEMSREELIEEYKKQSQSEMKDR